MKSVLLSLLTFLLLSNLLLAEPTAHLNPRILIGETNVSYDANGSATMGGSSSISYEQRGQTVRLLSTYFISSAFFGVDETNYDTTVLIHTNDNSSITIDDSVTLTNGSLYSTVHSLTTSSYGSNEMRNVTDQMTTSADGSISEAIITETNDFSTNYTRYLSESRDTNGDLFSWTLYSWTNDPVHSQQFTLYEAGGSDESNPDIIETETNTFDSLGNLILSTSQVQFGGFSSSTVTSNNYLLSKQGEILSSTIRTDYGADGTVSGVGATTFTHDKFGNLSGQQMKQFAGDGTFMAETVSSFVTDQFGDVLYAESIGSDATGVMTGRTVQGNTYVPRGYAYDRSSAVQHFLSHIRARPTRFPRQN